MEPLDARTTLDFGLATRDIIDALRRVADKREDVFTLLQCDRVTAGPAWCSIYREMPLDALSLDGSWQYAIRSRRLHPALPTPEPRDGIGWPGEFALNGLILLSHPDPAGRSERSRSSIGVVTRIAHEHSEAVHDHRESDALFAAVKRALHSAGTAV